MPLIVDLLHQRSGGALAAWVPCFMWTRQEMNSGNSTTELIINGPALHFSTSRCNGCLLAKSDLTLNAYGANPGEVQGCTRHIR